MFVHILDTFRKKKSFVSSPVDTRDLLRTIPSSCVSFEERNLEDKGDESDSPLCRHVSVSRLSSYPIPSNFLITSCPPSPFEIEKLARAPSRSLPEMPRRRSLKVKILLKTEGGYPKEAGVTSGKKILQVSPSL